MPRMGRDCRVDFCFHASSRECSGHAGCCGQSPALGREPAAPHPLPPACKTLADPVFWHLFQCPRINGIKVHTNKCNRRQVVLDLQIW